MDSESNIEVNRLRKRITDAFPICVLSAPAQRDWRAYVESFSHEPNEGADGYAAYSSWKWPEVPDATLSSGCPSQLSLPHVAFNYYLPRFLIHATEHPWEMTSDSIVRRMTDPSYDCKWLLKKQADVLLEFLTHLKKNAYFDQEYLRSKVPVLSRKLASCNEAR
jgi:hypothetical protein